MRISRRNHNFYAMLQRVYANTWITKQFDIEFNKQVHIRIRLKASYSYFTTVCVIFSKFSDSASSENDTSKGKLMRFIIHAINVHCTTYST